MRGGMETQPRKTRPPIASALDRLIIAIGVLGRYWAPDRRAHARVVTRPLGEIIHHVSHAMVLEERPIADEDPILRDHHRAGYKAALEMIMALGAVSAKRWAPTNKVHDARVQAVAIARGLERRLAGAERRVA
jgi:hypothetical protein